MFIKHVLGARPCALFWFIFTALHIWSFLQMMHLDSKELGYLSGRRNTIEENLSLLSPLPGCPCWNCSRGWGERQISKNWWRESGEHMRMNRRCSQGQWGCQPVGRPRLGWEQASGLKSPHSKLYLKLEVKHMPSKCLSCSMGSEKEALWPTGTCSHIGPSTSWAEGLDLTRVPPRHIGTITFSM